MTYILAIDQGTTSTRAILFDAQMQIAARAQQEFTQHFPQSGWVEHDPEEIWQSVVSTCKAALGQAGVGAADVAGIGITNQRETVVIWEKATGKPVRNAIVWQDRRTASRCAQWRAEGLEEEVTAKTGLLMDPYFSATKLSWILDQHDTTRNRAEAGDLLWGTIDTYLIWRMTGGARHVTDATNAARTMLYNIHDGAWDADLMGAMGVPQVMMPEVLDCAADFGVTDLLGGQTPILGVAGDQQAATLGNACFEPGMLKSTYGTGCFALLNTGAGPVTSQNRLLTTIAYQLDGQATYALEGSIFIAGAVVQWLRDGLRIIKGAPETQAMAEAADPGQDVIVVPAFTGLGAPYWDAECRGAIYGLARNSGPNELARAALESVGYQTRDLLVAMQADMSGAADSRDTTKTTLRVDGGMTASDWTMQFLADILGAPVDRPAVLETTALGAAWLAGMRSGVYPGKADFAETWALERRFTPQMQAATRETKYAAWKDAVARTLSKT